MRYDPDNTTVIHGGAKGLDTIVDIAARMAGFSVISYPANWSSDPKRAGILRNSEMLHDNKPTKVIGFRTKVNSRGTNDMIYKASVAGIEVEIIDDFK